MLRLLSLLQTHRYWTGPELAGRLDVSERTLRRDVDRLRVLGYPVDATRGAAGGYQLQAGASLPPLLVADDEAVAIAVGLQASAGTGASAFDDAAVRALSKIVQVMPPRLRRRVKALQDYTDRGPMYGPSIDAVLLSVLAQTCRDDERLELVYHRADGERTRRTVEPHRLVSGVAGGTSSRTTSSAVTGAPSGLTACRSRVRPASGSASASCLLPTRRRS